MIDLTAYMKTCSGKPVAVLGLGLSGLACIRAVKAAGYPVHAWDDNPRQQKMAAEAGAVIDSFDDMNGYEFLVLSPGIPFHFPQPHPVVIRARQTGTEIIGDIELLHRAGHGLKTIGITGTNGKSTTTALIGHILNEAGIKAAVGGNIGKAVLDFDLQGCKVIVLELSSYQLDLCDQFSADIAVHLNLTPDHIDRHGSLQGYVDAKMRIFRGRGEAVIGADDEASKSMGAQVEARNTRKVRYISSTRAIAHGVSVVNGILYDGDHDMGSVKDCLTLPGQHNHQNIAAAYAVCRMIGVSPGDIMMALHTYPGLPHRMFLLRTINGIAYVNDSKATNADAAGKALACYEHIYWILGGKAKEGGLSGLEPFMGHVAKAYVIGEATEEFSGWLTKLNIAHAKCGTIDKAVSQAHSEAQLDQKSGAVVLLSPACASFDQFRSFEHRGQVFTDLVAGLDDNLERIHA